MKNLNGLLPEKNCLESARKRARPSPCSQEVSGNHQSTKQFGRARHQSRRSVMPVDTVWHWYWALLGNSKTTSLHIFRGPKNEKGKQIEALIEASGHFPIRVVGIVRQRTTAWPYFQWPSAAPRSRNLAHSFLPHLIPTGKEPCNARSHFDICHNANARGRFLAQVGGTLAAVIEDA